MRPDPRGPPSRLPPAQHLLPLVPAVDSWALGGSGTRKQGLVLFCSSSSSSSLPRALGGSRVGAQPRRTQERDRQGLCGQRGSRAAGAAGGVSPLHPAASGWSPKEALGWGSKQLLEFAVTELLLLKQGFVRRWLFKFKVHKMKENSYLWTCFGVASL